MSWIDWAVLLVSIGFITIYGILKTRKGNKNIDNYLRGSSTNGWTIGLAVMATQASAITFLSTPGQAFSGGLTFVQFYFGLPLAIIVVSIFFIPIFHKLKVITAYEFLENRFDLKTRLLTAGLFLIQRGMAAGITIYAPAIILSKIMNWPLDWVIIIIGIVVIIYTVSGGADAVNKTQKQQMLIILGGIILAFILIIDYLPEGIGVYEGFQIAGADNKAKIIDFSFDPNNRYTLWSGLIGGFFLQLSYFGTDQSQVARYLSGKNLKEIRIGLLFNAILKIPMQFFILCIGLFVFVFYQFNPSPIIFDDYTLQKAKNSKEIGIDINQKLNETKELQNKKTEILENWNQSRNPELLTEFSQVKKLEDSKILEIKDKIKNWDESLNTQDKDYVFISFILSKMPIGIIGLLIAVIICAAMSSTSSELSALGSTSLIDFYSRAIKLEDDEKKVKIGKWLTLLWGLIAIGFALMAQLFENLIVLVNHLGSLFYGTILGIFICAIFFKKLRGSSVFWGGLISQILVLYISEFTEISFLWFNLFGCVFVLIFSYLIQFIFPLSKNKKITQ